MPACLVTNASGQLVIDTTQTVVTNCQMVVFTGAEVSSLQASPFNLSVQDAQQIGSSIIGCWAVAFGFRFLAGFLDGWLSTQNQEEL